MGTGPHGPSTVPQQQSPQSMSINAFHDPAVLERALTLARTLWQVAKAIEDAESGRVEAMGTAMNEWIGPHADTFIGLHDDERTAVATAVGQLQAEAKAWARYWLDCTNARTDRIYDERAETHDRSYRQPDGTLVEDAPPIPQRGTIYSFPPAPPAFYPNGDVLW